MAIGWTDGFGRGRKQYGLKVQDLRKFGDSVSLTA